MEETNWRREETNSSRTKPVLTRGEIGPKQSAHQDVAGDQQRSSVMSAIISLIYREYCRARLAEIQKLVG